MATKRNAYPDAVVDLEAGTIDDLALKAAGFVAESFYADREHARVEADIADFVLDTDTSLTRAARDRDRAMPRDVTNINDRKRRRLPGPGEFRKPLSSRQHQQRSAAKRRVQQAAPATGRKAMARLVGDQAQWAGINEKLRDAISNAQQLETDDRVFVQRIDRLIQTYERDNDRGHVVYVVAQLPDAFQPTITAGVPSTLQPGSRISFDQFTVAHHTLQEAVHYADKAPAGTVVLEIETGRGIFLGNSTDDTGHLLPRGLGLISVAVDEHALHPDPTGSGVRETLVVQCTDSPRT